MAPSGWLERLRPSPPWQSVLYQALDLETSGLEAQRDEILSVGIVPVRDGIVRFGERFASLVRPRDLSKLSLEGLRAHHILPLDLADAPPLAQVLPEIARRLEGAVLLLHHAAIDLGFLRQAFRVHRLRWPAPAVVDTVALLAKLESRRQFLDAHPEPLPGSLAEARAYFGLPEYPNHEALTDAVATAELFLALRHRLGAKTLRQLR